MKIENEKKTRNCAVCFSLGILLLLICFRPDQVNASYSGITSDSIKQKEKQISDAQEQKKQLESTVSDLQKILKDLETSKSNLDTYVKKLDVELNSITEKLNELAELITKKEEEIRRTKEELKEAEQVEQEQYEAMKARIQFMYEKGDTFLLETLFSSKSFGEFLNKADYIEMLSAYDRKMLNEFTKTREAVEALKASLEAEQEVLEEAKAASQKEQDAMAGLISQKEVEINAFESDINNKEQIKKEYEAEIASQNAEIQALEAAVAEERKRIAAANGALSRYDGGQFAWPAPSYTRISDDYGNRTHPILGTQQFHNGIDMAAPSGSPILAAYDGKVVQAAYSGTMGNYIMIDHGDSLYTIYMHASALHVSAGAVVTRGQKIASVGSTGRSTGPHLHFSVRRDGSYVSPWNFIG